ncbi:MAG: Uma2 family endonuclease [Pseudomonadota bacterium]
MQQTALPKTPMTADEFFAWAETWPDGERYELYDGVPVRMPSERVRHALCKSDADSEFKRAIEAAGIEAVAYPDGMAVQVSDYTVLEPDGIIAARIPDDLNEVRIQDAIVVVEVLSPSTKTYDQKGKLPLYFTMPMVAFALIVDSEAHTVVCHSRQAPDTPQTFGPGDTMALDPPGILVDVTAFFRRVM